MIHPADFESYSLDKFLKLFCEGQTVAVDMLFATPLLKHDFMREGIDNEFADEWLAIWDNRYRLMSRQCAPFLGYCKKQANK